MGQRVSKQPVPTASVDDILSERVSTRLSTTPPPSPPLSLHFSSSPSPSHPSNHTDRIPETATDPILIESGEVENYIEVIPSDDEIPEQERIPAPQTCDLNGNKYEWVSLQGAFDALQEFAKEHGFAV